MQQAASNTCYQWQLLRLSGSVPVTINVLPGTTGINEQPLFNVMNVYPNPASDIISASFDLSRESEVSVKIMNLSGQVVFSHPADHYQVGSHKIEFNATGLAKGMYMVEIQSEDVKVNRKIVVQ